VLAFPGEPFAPKRAAATEAVLGAAPGRFRWLDAACIDAAARREVLASLFEPASGPMN